MTNLPSMPASPAKLDLYLDRLAAENPHGRLVFALDATMSRQPTWDRAVELQTEMFAEAARIGGLEMMLIYYRGDECRASKWMTDGKRLAEAMRRIECVGGYTQIEKVLKHAQQAHDKSPIAAVVLVADAMEEEIDALRAGANKLASRGVKIFAFQEGGDETAEKAFKEIARLTHGAYCQFAEGSVQELRELLRAVARFAAGGLKALGKGETATKLLEQLK